MSTGNQQLLRRYAKPIFVSSAVDDTTAPFSFKDWYDAYRGIIPGQEFNQYNEYLVEWYKNKSEQVVDFKLTLKLNYLTLLKQLQLFFSREEAENWYSQVNLDNEKELLLAIPYFAKKLKDISLYYLQLRNSIKESRLKYNQTGTNAGTIQQLQKLILTNYTKKPNSSISLPSSVWRDVPELSSVKDFISLEIEELYDTQDYFDQIPTLPVSAYYNVNDTELQNFLLQKGLQISDTDWVYKIGANFLQTDFSNLSTENISDLSLELSRKYLGQNKFISTTTQFSAKTDFYDISIDRGNNYFYWPEGTYKTKTNTLPRYQEININSSGLNSVATAGSSIEVADTVFVQTTRGLSGAWFRKQVYDYQNKNLEALIEPSTKTIFRFPYPGYGLSAEDINWTGYGLVYEPRFFFLENKLQQAILDTYWSQNFELTSTTPLKINDTTLIDGGAYPNTNFNRSDKVTVWTNPPQYNETSFTGKATEAWLYRMNQTDISIGLNDNTILWPYQKIDPLTEFPEYYTNNLTDVCTTLPVSSINFSYAIAGNALSSADVIYKLTNYNDTVENAVECCWLSGNILDYSDSNLILTKQNNFQLLLESGKYTDFVWFGIDNTDVEDVFKTIKHQPDCNFVQDKNTTYANFAKCNCKQVLFVPFGHPGAKYEDYGRFTDFIVEGKFIPGITDITKFVSTSAFAWYRTNSKIGFGDGRWVSGDLNADNQFYLQQGKVYTYYRALIPQQTEENATLPNYVVRYKTNLQTEKSHQWIRSIKDSDGNWISTNIPSPMTISPGEILLYNRSNTLKYSLTGTTLQTIDITENRGSIWSNYDYITIGKSTNLNLRPIILSFPYEANLNYTEIGKYQTAALTPPSSTDTPVVLVSSYISENILFNVYNVTSVSSVNTTSSLSATTFARIISTDPTPKTYGVYYEPNNTVTFVYQVTSLEIEPSNTISILVSSINVPSQLSSAAINQIRAVDPSPNTYGIYYESNNTVTLFFQITSLQTASVDIRPPQVPPITINNIVSILQWEITSPNGQKTYFRNTPTVTFYPNSTGIYTTALTAMSSSLVPPRAVFTSASGATFFYANTGLFIFSNIPPITATPDFITVPTLTSYNTPVPGYTLNTKLYGWDYGANKANPYAREINAGAKPYWAKSNIEKNEATGFKGINAWGTPQRVIDEHNIITQPEVSELILNAGDRVEYTRNYPSPLNWIQPVNLKITVNTSNWCALDFNTSSESNLSYFLENYKNKLVVTPTTATSLLKFENYVDNEPEEIFYNAINPFVWNITATPLVTETVFTNVCAEIGINAEMPWANLPNRHYPTVAAFPAFNNLYSDTDIGGYFVPKNLGAGVYVDQDYTATLSLTSTALSSYFQDVTKQYGGRGLTKEELLTPYANLIENNIWLKEPTVAGPIAGTIKKKIFKKYQKFIPYQSGYESNPRLRIGLLTPTSRQSPWTGNEDSEWGDLQNQPLSPTGELNVQAWSDSQILKQTGLQIDNWCTDIFGNQYGLYKALSGSTPYSRKFIPGEIWVRKNSQYTSPSYIGLKDVFDTYQTASIFHELTGKGVRKIDLFFDTLLIEISGAIIFEKINYDFNNDNIFSLTDEARYISLAMPVSANLDREFANINLSDYTFAHAGETWFFPDEKFVTQSICGLKNNVLTPELYQLDLNTQILRKIFPTNDSDISLINQLTDLNLISIEAPTLSHNSLRKEYLLTILGKNNNNNKTVIIEIKIKDLTQLYIDEIVVYNPIEESKLVNPPLITQSLKINVSITNLNYLNALNFQCIAENGPVIFERVSVPSWITLSPTGLFTGTPPLNTAQYIAEFKVTNSVGPSYYSLIIDVQYIEILELYYFVTEGYELSGDNGFLVQEEHDLGDIGNGLVSRLVE